MSTNAGDSSLTGRVERLCLCMASSLPMYGFFSAYVVLEDERGARVQRKNMTGRRSEYTLLQLSIQVCLPVRQRSSWR
jgi:hypothetical protein